MRPLISIQVLRAIAALAVLFGHFWREFNQFGPNHSFPNLVFGGAGVDLFFVISGFVVVYSSESFFAQPGGSVKFLLRRLARIVPLYWTVSAAWLLYLLHLRGTIVPEDLSWTSVGASFIFLPYPRPSGANVPLLGVGWTLNYEMFFYLCLAFAVTLPRRAAVISVTAFFAALVVICRFEHPGPFNPLSVLADPIIFEFVYGMLIALAYRAGIRIPVWGTLALVATGIAVFSCSAVYDLAPRYIVWGGVAVCLVSGLTLSTATPKPGAVVRGLAAVGNASYALYLTHNAVMFVPRTYIAPMVDPVHHPWVYASVLLTWCLGVAIATYHLFERPLTTRLQNWIGLLSWPFVAGASRSQQDSGRGQKPFASPP